MKTTTPNQNQGLKSRPEQLSTDNKPGNVYEQITERMVAMLETGVVPWRKPWNVQARFPRNLISGKPYRGINVFLLHAMNYESPFWLTWRQAHELGGFVRKGEKACPVVFWKQLEIEDTETGELEKVPMARFYYAFNLSQCEGLKDVATPAAPAVALSRPEEIIANMPQRPAIKYGMRQAFYSPAEDIIGMPDRERFASEAEFFSTLYHESCHATGSKTRLNRPTLTEAQGFGSDPYCKEELIAEMGAAFLCGQVGIEGQTLENSAAYVQNWLKKLQNDKKLIVQAAAQAQRAADFILGVKYEAATAQPPETATV